MGYDIFLDIFEKENALFNEPMSGYTSFRIGGPADLVVFPSSLEELKNTLILCAEKGFPYFIMGNGSNLLVRDKGFRGVVICLSKGFDEVRLLEDNCSIEAYSGISMARLSAFAMNNNLAGLEFASGIPGSLGGAIYMNAGAYDSEMKDVTENVYVVDNNYEEIVYNKEQMNFSYRSSILQEKKNNFVITRCTIKLLPGEYSSIKARTVDLNNRRKEKQPLDIPSAGSTFKRPDGFFAAKLIDEAGLKGYTVGGAMVSKKHGGFIVNFNKATANDVLAIIKHVKFKVYEKFNVELEPEIRIIGD